MKGIFFYSRSHLLTVILTKFMAFYSGLFYPKLSYAKFWHWAHCLIPIKLVVKCLFVGPSTFPYCTFSFAIEGFELRTLHLLGQHSTTWAMPPVLFILVIFEIQSYIISRLVWNAILLFVLPCTDHCVQTLGEMGAGGS
jgi:hypothetical protein